MELQLIELVRQLAGENFTQQFIIWTSSLALASYIHSGRVKSALNDMTVEIRSMVTSMNANLEVHAKEIAQIKSRQDNDNIQNNRQDDRLSRMEQSLIELQTLVKTDIQLHGQGPQAT